MTHELERRTFLGMAISAFPIAVLGQSTATPDLSHAIRVPDGEDRTGSHHAIGLSSTDYKVLTNDSNGSFFLFQHTSTKKGGPPRHLHHGQEEWFYVLQGDYIAEVGSDRYQLKAGDSLLAPREIPHAWAFVGSTPGKMLVGFTPANKMEAFFEATLKRNGPGAIAGDADLFHDHGMELIGPPLTV